MSDNIAKQLYDAFVYPGDKEKALSILSSLPDPTVIRDNWYLLHYAAVHGWLDIVIKLITQYNCDPYSENNYGWTLLHFACNSYCDRTDIVKYLTSTFCLDPLKEDENGDTPLSVCVGTETEKYLQNIIDTAKKQGFGNVVDYLRHCRETSIFDRAIHEGSGNLKPAVVVMHGPPGAGKTSVKQLLLGRPPLRSDEENSTDILERPIRTCRVKSGGIHRLCEVNKEQFHQMLLNSVHAESTGYRDRLTNIDKPLHQVSDLPTPPPPSAASHTSTLIASEAPVLKQPFPRLKSSNTLKVMRENLSTAKSSRDLFEVDWIYLVDSGGQPQFTDVLPLLFRSEALYIVVIRLDEDLDKLQSNCYCLQGRAYELPGNLSLTNRQIIERACQIAEAHSSSLLQKQVVVIGTRFDKLVNADAKVRQIDDELLKLQQSYEGVLVPKDANSGKVIFPVNAMSTGAEREAYTTELQECLINIVKQSIKPIEVPLKWFVYELDLDEASKETHGVVRKSKCDELGGDLGMTSGEIEHSLHFFNRLALHLYHPNDENFPDLILIRMDPLTDRLSNLIRTTFDRPKNFPTKECTKLKKCGLFQSSYLQVAFKDIYDNDALTHSDFLRISQCLKVIVHVRGDEYFIPSALSVQSQTDLVYHRIPVVYNWKEYILPSGFFFTLVIMLLRKEDEVSSERLFSISDCVIFPQSRDRLDLFVESYGGTLTLTNAQKWIGVYYSGITLEDYIELLKLIHYALVTVVDQFNKVAGIKFPYISFLCPICDTRDHHHHPCSLNKRRSHCFCKLYRHNSPVTDEMRTIIESLQSLPVSSESVRDVRNRKRKERETSEVVTGQQEKEPITHKRKSTFKPDIAATGMAPSCSSTCNEPSIVPSAKRNPNLLDPNNRTVPPSSSTSLNTPVTATGMAPSCSSTCGIVPSTKRNPNLLDPNNNTDQSLPAVVPLVDDTILSATSMNIISILESTITVTDWFNLGLKLDLAYDDLERIRLDNSIRGQKDCQREMVRRWLDTGRASWCSLVQALMSPLIDKEELAMRLAKQHSKTNR